MSDSLPVQAIICNEPNPLNQIVLMKIGAFSFNANIIRTQRRLQG